MLEEAAEALAVGVFDPAEAQADFVLVGGAQPRDLAHPHHFPGRVEWLILVRQLESQRQLVADLEALPTFDAASIEAATRSLMAERGWQPKDLIHPARVAVTGRAVSPPLFETMVIIGREAVLSRLQHAGAELAKV